MRDTPPEISQQVSVLSDRPFPIRHCKTEAFNIVRITPIHRLNLPRANLQRQCHCLCAGRQPTRHSPSSQHFRQASSFLQELRVPASHLLTPCTSSSLEIPNDLCKQDCWEIKMSPVLINTHGWKSSKLFISFAIIYDFLTA